MIKGIDVSHHNDLGQLLTRLKPSERKFIIIKATEGKTFRDPSCILNTRIAESETDLIGYYHYARPELNNPIDEAKNFLSHPEVKSHIGKAILALDWEDKALHSSIDWAKQWLEYVYKETGVKPLFYCSSWYTAYLHTILAGGFGLWVAHYTRLSKPYIGCYRFWAFWQYGSPSVDSSFKCDYDYFNGTAQQFKKYAKSIIDKKGDSNVT